MSDSIGTSLAPGISALTGMLNSGPNPLDVVTKVQQAQGQALQNAQAQQELAYRGAIGGVVQQSIGPDGKLDPSAFLQNAAANPATAFKAPEIFETLSKGGLINAETEVQKLAAARSRLQNLSSTAVSLLPKGPSVTDDDIDSALQTHLVNGDISPQEAVNFKTSLPSDGVGKYNTIRQFALGGLSALDGLNQVYGSITNVNRGGSVVPTQQSSFMSYSAPVAQGSGEIPVTPTPSERNALVQVPNPQTGGFDNRPRYAAAPLSTGTGQPAPGSVSPAAPPTPATQTPAASQFWQTYYPAMTERARQSQIAAVPLNNMVNIIDDTRFGGGTTTRAYWAQRAQALGIPDRFVNDLAGGDLSKFQEYEKDQLLSSVATLKSQLGNVVSNDEFNRFTSVIGNPNSDPRTLRRVVGQMRDLQVLQAREPAAFTSYMQTPGADPGKWSALWNRAMKLTPEWQNYAGTR